MFKGFRSIILALLVLCFVPIVLAYPSILINSPLNQTYNVSSITFNVTLNDTGACNYSLDFGVTNISMNSEDNLTNLTFSYIDTLSDNIYTVMFYCSDSMGDVNTTSVSFAVDTTYPTIIFNPDTDNTTLVNRNYIIINVSVNDTNFNYTSIDIYNATGELINVTTYISVDAYINYTVPTNGVYFFNATVYDNVGHVNNTETRNMTIDTTAPTFDNLNNQTIKNNESLLYDINATDTYAGVSCFQINDTTNFKINCTGILENNTQLTKGTYSIAITVNDTLNNERTETIIINITESDLIAPSITINNPTNTIYNNATILINISASDIHLDKIWYNYNGTDYTYTTSTNITFNEGITTLHVWANDTIGNLNYTNVTFTIDTTNPMIIFNPDTDNTQYINRNYIIINITSNDTNLNYTIINIYNSTYDLINTTTSISTEAYINYTVPTNGVYFFNATVYDNVGHVNNTETRNITIDTTAPTITFHSPSSSNTTIYIANILFNLTATDAHIQNITLYVYNETYALIFNTTASNNISITLTNLTDGIYYYNATAYDVVGNVNSTELYNITIDTTIPVIYYESTTDNTQFVNRDYIQINVTTLNMNTTNLTINIYNSSMSPINSTSAINTTNLFVNFTGLADGKYYFNATADDGLGTNVSTEIKNLTIDTINPEIIFNPDTDNTQLVNRPYIIINITSNDANSNTTIIRIYNSTYDLINTTNYTGTGAYINYTVPTDGVYFFNATVYDLTGHTNSTETRNITIDATAPVITIITPTNIITNKNYIEFNITLTDDHIGNTTLYFYNSTFNLINTTNSTTTELFYNITGLTEDMYYYNITSIDTLGNTNSTVTYNITIDQTSPSITINNPTNTIYNTTTILVNITTDGNNIWFYNGTANQTYLAPTNITWSEGINNIYAYTNDTAGNINYTNTTFIVDTTAPIIIFNTPNSSNITSTTASNTFNITATDTNIQNLTFYLYDNTSTLVYNKTANTSNIYVTISLTNGTYYYNATAYDTLGHVNSTETRNITVSIITIIPPPGGGSSKDNTNPGTGTTNTYFPPTNNRTTVNESVTIIEYLTDLQKGQRNISINRIGAAITLLTLDINNSINTSNSIKIITQTNNPLKEIINATIYTYMTFNTTIQPEYINGINFRFKIEKTWITKNNLTAQNMTIYLYNINQSSWSDSDLSKYSEDEEYVYYSSNSTKFTTLALGSPLVRYIPSIITENNKTEIVSGNNSNKNNNLATIKNKDFFQSAGDFFSNAWQNIKIFATNLSPDIQSLVIITMSSIFILIIGVVSGVLLYKNTIKPRRMRRTFNKTIIGEGRIMPYEEEPPKEPTPPVVPPVEPIKLETPKVNNSTTPDPEFCVRKINELLLQCEYALDNGKIAEAKEDYANARKIYFNSGLDYEEKSRVYNKIIELYARFNKK